MREMRYIHKLIVKKKMKWRGHFKGARSTWENIVKINLEDVGSGDVDWIHLVRDVV